MLAILSTGAVAALILGTLALAVFFITGFVDSDREPSQGVIADSVARELATKELRKQIISFQKLKMLDSASNVYILPVGNVNLQEPEKSVRFKHSSAPRYEGENQNYTFNNIILYSLNSGELTPLFNSRIAISRYGMQKIANEVYLFLEGADRDTNHDGILNNNDLENLYVYSWRTEHVNKVSVPNSSFLNYTLLNNANDVIINFGLDENKDGKF